MNYLSECIVDFYVKRNIIKEDEKVVYQYGIELIINDIFTFSLIILISTLFWKLRYAVEFLAVFCVTRVFCGGFHAKKPCMCKLLMIFIFFCVMMMSSILSYMNTSILRLLLNVGFVVILPLIPVRHPNKQLNNKEMRDNKFWGIITYSFFCINSYLVWVNASKQDGAIIAISLCTVSMLVIIGRLVNGRR